jgi:hypothetical protein
MFKLSISDLKEAIRLTNKIVISDSSNLAFRHGFLLSSSLSSSSLAFISPPSLSLSLFLPTVGVSLLLHPSSSSSAGNHSISVSSTSVSFRPRELCYALCDGVSLVYDETRNSQRIVFRIGDVQVDNGNAKATFPVVMRRVGKMRITLPRPSLEPAVGSFPQPSKSPFSYSVKKKPRRKKKDGMNRYIFNIFFCRKCK